MKLTDYQRVDLGLMDEKQTWYWKKMEGFAKEVREGQYGECLKEWMDFAGDGDGFKCFYFVVFVHEAPFVVKVSESGVFQKSASGFGWVPLRKESCL